MTKDGDENRRTSTSMKASRAEGYIVPSWFIKVVTCLIPFAIGWAAWVTMELSGLTHNMQRSVETRQSVEKLKDNIHDLEKRIIRLEK